MIFLKFTCLRNIRLILILIATLLFEVLTAQVLRNEGKINVAGGYLVISGSYQNESIGGITLDGIVTVSGNWTNNGSLKGIDTPGTNGEVIFNGVGAQTIDGTANEFDFEKLTVNNSGDSVKVSAGKGVTAYGDCSFSTPFVLKTTKGDFRPIMATFINKTSNVTGNITSELYYRSTGSSAAGAGRGLYFSSPITNANSTIFNVPTNILYYQDEIARKYVLITAAQALTVGKGYFIRSATHKTFKFTGPANKTTSYTQSIPKWDNNHYYLMGNPYPSIIDWNTIDKTNNINTTIWYRTCDASGNMVTADTYNSASGLGTSNYGAPTDPKVDGNIPPMQSFWIQCIATTAKPTMSGSITINDSDRSHNWGNTTFLKSSRKQDNDVLRLYLHSGNYRDENIFAQSESAQYSYDEWDSKKFFLGDVKIAELYTVSSDSYNLAIQSVKPITNADSTIKVGVNIGTAGTYKFTADLSKVTGPHNIFLYDKLMNVKQDLFLNPEYTFTSIVENTTTRFSLIFAPAPKLLISNPLAVCAPATVDLTDPSITKGSDDGLIFTYWLNSQATTPYPTPAKAEAGTYYIKGTASNGSYSVSQPIEVSINPLPTIVASAPAPVCAPSSVDLTSSLITNGSTSGLTYTYWTDKDATMAYATPTNATNGSYYIKGTTDKGCFTISEPIVVSVNPKPTISVSAEIAVCDPLKVDLTSELITSGSTAGLTYTYWTDKDATIIYDTPTAASEGNYYIKGTTDKGCFTISEPIIVSTNPKPTVTVNPPDAVCDPLRVDLTSELITNGSTSGIAYTYWTDKDATVSYTTPTSANSGSYYIKGTTDKGCFAISDAIVVTVNPKPLVVTTNPSPAIYPATVDLTKPEITVGSTTGLTFSYWLDNAATLVYPTPQTAIAGNYYIKGTIDITGCFSIAGPVAVTILTDVDINKTNDIKIYSSSKQIIIENGVPKSLISIYDITGRQYYSGTLRTEKEIIPFNFNTGLYIVRLVNSQNVQSQKVYLR